VPNLASVQAAIGGDRWFHQDVPRHVVHFTDCGVRLLLDRSGFEVARVHHLLLEQNLLGMWQTLQNRLTTRSNVMFDAIKGGRPRLARDTAVAAVAAPVLLPLAAALELGAGLLGRGGTIVVEATKR
jgi:hypothetical protein